MEEQLWLVPRHFLILVLNGGASKNNILLTIAVSPPYWSNSNLLEHYIVAPFWRHVHGWIISAYLAKNICPI